MQKCPPHAQSPCQGGEWGGLRKHIAPHGGGAWERDLGANWRSSRRPVPEPSQQQDGGVLDPSPECKINTHEATGISKRLINGTSATQFCGCRVSPPPSLGLCVAASPQGKTLCSEKPRRPSAGGGVSSTGTLQDTMKKATGSGASSQPPQLPPLPRCMGRAHALLKHGGQPPADSQAP